MRDSERDTDVKNRLLDSVGEEEGGMIWENGIETYILSCKKWITSLGWIQDTGCLGLVHWDDPERWYGEGGGRGGSGLGTHVHPRSIHVNVWQNQYSIIKQRCYFADKGPSSQRYGFSSSRVWMWQLDHKEGWVPKNWCFELWCWIRLMRIPWIARR